MKALQKFYPQIALSVCGVAVMAILTAFLPMEAQARRLIEETHFWLLTGSLSFLLVPAGLSICFTGWKARLGIWVVTFAVVILLAEHTPLIQLLADAFC
jgi:hypothetical protein